MIFPDYSQIVELHRESIRQFGGERGILDDNGLKGFIDSIPQSVLFGQKTRQQTACYIYVRLVQNHYFVDGNKRVGLGVFMTFLHVNGCNWKEELDLYDMTIKIASSTMKLEEVEYIIQKAVEC